MKKLLSAMLVLLVFATSCEQEVLTEEASSDYMVSTTTVEDGTQGKRRLVRSLIPNIIVDDITPDNMRVFVTLDDLTVLHYLDAQNNGLYFHYTSQYGVTYTFPSSTMAQGHQLPECANYTLIVTTGSSINTPGDNESDEYGPFPVLWDDPTLC